MPSSVLRSLTLCMMSGCGSLYLSPTVAGGGLSDNEIWDLNIIYPILKTQPPSPLDGWDMQVRRDQNLCLVLNIWFSVLSATVTISETNKNR